MGLIPSKQLILAPRGEFSPGALALKSVKKKLFIHLAGMFRLYNNLVWQASSQHELYDIENTFGRYLGAFTQPTIIVAPDLPTPLNRLRINRTNIKKAGELKAVFLSRISAKKNLDGALSMLHEIKGKVSFNIYGPIEDQRYWEKCKSIINSLPNNISVQYMGAIANEQVEDVMSNHDLFFFPTHGENFGHVIQEALVAGCPILISDQTPWKMLAEKAVGWDLPLNRPDLFVNRLQKCVDMDDGSFQELSFSARRYGEENCSDQNVVDSNRILFNCFRQESQLKASKEAY